MAIMNDGFSTTIQFSQDTIIAFLEKTVTPPGVDGGDAIETTTMQNTAWRTMYPRSLKTLTTASVTVAWDPAVYDEIIAIININGQITVTFPDGDNLVFWGFLKSFTPNENTEGEQPTAEIEIEPTNQDLSLVEQAPVFSAS